MNIKDITQKLNSINIKDLKRIDASEIKDIALARPHILINAILVIVTLAAVIQIFAGQKIQSRNMKIQIPKLQEKIDTISKGELLQKELDAFFAKTPKPIDEDHFIDKISETAVSNNVQIMSFSPPVKTEDKQAQILTVTMTISAEDYDHFLSFIEGIEALPFSIKISQIKASLASTTPGKPEVNANKNPIQAQMEVNSVLLRK